MSSHQDKKKLDDLANKNKVLVNDAKQKENKGKKSTVISHSSEFDEVIPPPTPTSDMFYGLAGEVARIASDGTEINPVSAMLSFLSFLGANVGRDTFLLINNTYHHPRLFTLHIGRSSRGGKGDSQQLTHRIRKRIEVIAPKLLGHSHTGGLASGEGLAALIHDGYGETSPITDKRLWVVEGELANVLKKMAREGNVLSTVLREAWDGSDIKPAVKTRPMGVTEPHIGLHACITPSELTKMLGRGEIDNGFANRFLMVWAENVGCVAFPEATQSHVVEQLAGFAIDIIKYALGDYPESSNSKEMHLSQSAREFYMQVYRGFKTPLDNEQVAGLLARRAPYTIRLSMLFALMDKTRVIEVQHIKAAFAWIEYATDTTRFVFHSERQTEKATEIKKNAAKILTFIEESTTGVSASDINSQCFKKHTESAKIKEALNYLLAENPPLIEASKGTTKGRPKITYSVVNIAKKAKKGLGYDFKGVQGFDSLRINAKKGVKSPPVNEQKGLNTHYYAGENDIEQGYSPHGTAFYVNTLNTHTAYLGESPKQPENNAIKSENSNQDTETLNSELI